MSFIETPTFPKCVALGALSKPRYKTTVIPTLAGYQSRNIEWALPMHGFDFAKVMTQEQHDSLLAFFHATQGRGHQFRVRDPGDHSTTIATGVLLGLAPNGQLVASGTAGNGYKSLLAAKIYTAGALSTYRWLQKLVSGAVFLYRNGVAVTVGVGVGQIAIDVTTGKITFVADQSRAIASHVVGASHVINVSGGAFSPNFAVGGRVHIESATGTAAPILNGIAHEITNVAGATLTLNLNTAALTAGGGSAYYYVQPTETLTLVCDFDVPCVFSNDEAAFDLFQRNSAGENFFQWSGISLEEDRLALPTP
jgi:uncharacterized protein (TIGR02217 family)